MKRIKKRTGEVFSLRQAVGSAGEWTVKGMGFAVLAVLWLFSVIMTEYNGLAEDEIMFNEWDNPLWNIVCVGAVIAMIYLGSKIIGRSVKLSSKLAENIVLSVTLLFAFLISLWWVTSADRQPYADQAAIYGMARSIIEGDYSAFQPSGYLALYPQQLGLIAIVEAIFRVSGRTDYMLLQYINVALVPCIILAGYKNVELLWGKARYKIIYLVLMLLCAPLYIYSSWVYGEIPSLALTFLFTWLIIKLVMTNKNRWLLLALLTGILVTMLRTNTWIVMLGAALVLLVIGIRDKRWKPVLTAALILVLPFLVNYGIRMLYAWRSGYGMTEGIPTVLWIAMGLHWDYLGPGWFNNYCVNTFYAASSDPAAASGMAIAYIGERLSYFVHHLAEAAQFVIIKIATQWNDPLYQSLQLNSVFKEEPAGLLSFLCYGEGNGILKLIANRYHCVIMTGGLAYVVCNLRKKDRLLQMLGLVIVIGGFLFTIIWEAKARYAFPYFLMLIPYAAVGLGQLAEAAEKSITRFFTKNT